MKYLFFLISCCLVSNVYSQWSSPINITNGIGYPQSDFTIDAAGTIHCVFKGNGLRYTKSTDNGITWTEPVIIAQMDAQLNYAQIVADPNNQNLWIAYTYAPYYEVYWKIFAKKYNGIFWEDSILLYDRQCPYINDLLIDGNGRVYVIFMTCLDAKSYIKHCDNGIWSEPYCMPHPTNITTWFYKGQIDTDNNFHIGGIYSKYSIPDQTYVAYFQYLPQNNTWAAPILINNRIQFENICLDKYRHPHFLMLKNIILPPEEYVQCIIYQNYDGNSLSIPIIIDTIEQVLYPSQFIVDTNDAVHLIYYKHQDSTLVYCYKNKNDSIFHKVYFWNNSYFCDYHLKFDNNKLFLSYFKSPPKDMFFQSTKITTEIESLINWNENVLLYPNPFHDRLFIKLYLKYSDNVEINILAPNGCKIKKLVRTKLEQGEYQIVWNGNSDDNITTPPGIYFCQIKLKNKSEIKLIIKH